MTDKHIVIEGGAQGQLFMAGLVTKALLALIAIFAIAVFQLLTRTGTDAPLLAVGSVLSAVTLWMLLQQIDRPPSILKSLVFFGGYVPYFFGCYLVFYKGFWGLTKLSEGFSLGIMAGSVFFVLLGYAVVNGTYKVSEVGRRISEGTLRIGRK